MSQSYYVTTNADDLEKYKNAYVNYIKTFSKYYRSQYDEVDASDEAIDAMAEKIYEFERQIATNQVIIVPLLPRDQYFSSGQMSKIVTQQIEHTRNHWKKLKLTILSETGPNS